MFDEYEEWNLLNKHYAITIAMIIKDKKKDKKIFLEYFFDDIFSSLNRFKLV